MSHPLKQLLAQRIVILDGAMGTMIQQHNLHEADFHPPQMFEAKVPLKGNNDLLCLSRPDLITEIHLKYLQAGADIIETNTFSATSVGQSEYGLEHLVKDINKAAVDCAKKAIEQYRQTNHNQRPVFIAGALGPTNKTASLSADVSSPEERGITFDELVKTYAEQIEALTLAGADVILAETSFDTLNLKAAIFAYESFFDGRHERLPLMLSITLTDQSGRTLSGQTIEAAWISVRHARPISIGINCALGAREMRPFLEDLARVADTYVSCYPNAGLPNPLSATGYDETPDMTALYLGQFAEGGLVNIVGGCCGTTPDHIQAIAKNMKKYSPREVVKKPLGLSLSGLEPLVLSPDSHPFIIVGERTNVTGSPKFAELIRQGDYGSALKVAKQQVDNGANILDVNFDDGLLDSAACMTKFLNLVNSEPDIAKIPIMIDSSKWSVLEAGLKCLQGKAIVNSISLKEGEKEFLRQAKLIKRYGAAIMVMAFDENGQAATKNEKIRILKRAYDLLVNDALYSAADIVFDANVLTIGTGMDEHNNYAVDFIEAIKELKTLCPGALYSGGISNLSFSFRGLNRVREAMHSVFLFHAIKAGLDMGIVNAGMLEVYDDIEPELKNLVIDLVLNVRKDATERLLSHAEKYRGEKKETKELVHLWREKSLDERIAHALIHGIVDFIEEDTLAAYEQLKEPLKVIEGPLMAGMQIVGEYFGAGKMFLPQVVKSARVMKKAVAILEPLMRKNDVQSHRGTFVIATVKGDVHDIGKNIVNVVLTCNNYRVIDLGVMVPCEKILEVARKEHADFVGLSGLITPSLEEMKHVALAMEREGMQIPLLIGGATTSKAHTAIKIAPFYHQPVVHVNDASLAAPVCSQLLSKESAGQYIQNLYSDQKILRERFEEQGSGSGLINYPDACDRRLKLSFATEKLVQDAPMGVKVLPSIPLSEVRPFIDWSPFFWTWQLQGFYPKIFNHPRFGEQAKVLFADAQTMLQQLDNKKYIDLKAVYGLWSSAADGDDAVIFSPEDKNKEKFRFHFLRQQRVSDAEPCLSLTDYLPPLTSGQRDVFGSFAVTSGEALEEYARVLTKEHDDYNSILVKALADRLAEALAEYLHKKIRDLCGFGLLENLSPEQMIAENYRSIRPAPGYPACPDHSEKVGIWSLLEVEKNIGVKLTESCAMYPGGSVCGWYFFHPQAKYFRVGRINDQQLDSLALRKKMPKDVLEKWLAPNLV